MQRSEIRVSLSARSVTVKKYMPPARKLRRYRTICAFHPGLRFAPSGLHASCEIFIRP
jgi:hypothetical protein